MSPIAKSLGQAELWLGRPSACKWVVCVYSVCISHGSVEALPFVMLWLAVVLCRGGYQMLHSALACRAAAGLAQEYYDVIDAY